MTMPSVRKVADVSAAKKHLIPNVVNSLKPAELFVGVTGAGHDELDTAANERL